MVVRTIPTEVKGAYGSQRMMRELLLRGFAVGKEYVEKLMRENSTRAIHERRYCVTTDSQRRLPVTESLLA